jgi:hypothetical protein
MLWFVTILTGNDATQITFADFLLLLATMLAANCPLLLLDTPLPILKLGASTLVSLDGEEPLEMKSSGMIMDVPNKLLIVMLVAGKIGPNAKTVKTTKTALVLFNKLLPSILLVKHVLKFSKNVLATTMENANHVTT